MSTGALLFAFNTGSTDYLKLAEFSARNIRRWLDIPTTVITDSEVFSREFDTITVPKTKKSSVRYFSDHGRMVEWSNAGRSGADMLTPYDQTLLMDVDYVVASDQLVTILDSKSDFLCHSSAVEASGTKGDNDTFGTMHMPMWWATVMMFRKTEFTNTVFHLMRMIEKNYAHYSNLYGFPATPFRNDYVLSIALTIVSGHTISNMHSIPWPLINVHPEHSVKKLAEDCYEISYDKDQGQRQKLYKNVVKEQDMHVMGKISLEKIVDDE